MENLYDLLKVLHVESVHKPYSFRIGLTKKVSI